MCTIVFVGPEEDECSNHGALSAALGGAPIYKHPGDTPPGDRDCLCDLDIQRTADAFGYEITEDDGFFVVMSKVLAKEESQ